MSRTKFFFSILHLVVKKKINQSISFIIKFFQCSWPSQWPNLQELCLMTALNWISGRWTLYCIFKIKRVISIFCLSRSCKISILQNFEILMNSCSNFENSGMWPLNMPSKKCSEAQPPYQTLLTCRNFPWALVQGASCSEMYNVPCIKQLHFKIRILGLWGNVSWISNAPRGVVSRVFFGRGKGREWKTFFWPGVQKFLIQNIVRKKFKT